MWGCSLWLRRRCSIKTSFISPIGSPDRPAELLMGVRPTLTSAQDGDQLGVRGAAQEEE